MTKDLSTFSQSCQITSQQSKGTPQSSEMLWMSRQRTSAFSVLWHHLSLNSKTPTRGHAHTRVHTLRQTHGTHNNTHLPSHTFTRSDLLITSLQRMLDSPSLALSFSPLSPLVSHCIRWCLFKGTAPHKHTHFFSFSLFASFALGLSFGKLQLPANFDHFRLISPVVCSPA